MHNVDVLFIVPPFHLRNGGGAFFPLGVGYIISSIERHGHSWELINCSEIIETFFEKDLKKLESILLDRIINFNPTVIGIGPCVTSQLKALQIIANVCKSTLPNVPLFAGGPFASISGQESVFDNYIGIKYLVKGDGESAVPEIIDTIKRCGSIEDSSSVSYDGHTHVNVIKDINSLAYPYRPQNDSGFFSRRRENGMNQFAMIASRGCVYECSYCVSGCMKNNYLPFRKRTNENIIGEMLYLKEQRQAKGIVFYDDLFFSNYARINDDVSVFSRMLLNYNMGMEWQIEMRPDYFVALSNNSLDFLQQSGCKQINLGIEKATDKGLAFLEKYGNRTGLLEKMQFAQSIGIKLSATFILGGDEEQPEDIKQLIAYAKSLPIDFAHFNPLFVYPGTSLYNKVYKTPYAWAEDVLQSSLPWGEIVYENKYLKTNDLLNLIDFAYAEFYDGTSYLKDNMVSDRFNLKK